jgi:formate dehydrogenase subunit gamma
VATISRCSLLVIGALTLAVALMAMLAESARAQQPSSVNPNASAVQEQQLLDRLQSVQGRISIPDEKAATLIQPDGQAWRQFHEVTLKWLGAVSVLGTLVLLVVFYLGRGMVRIEGGRTGRTLVRFNGFERFIHWLTATCFIALALSGLNITFGKTLLLPAIGADAFASVSQWGKYAHNYLSFPFTIGVALIFISWLGHNIPNARDLEWFRRGGGFVGGDHPPAAYFNGGQKAVYWVVVLAGTAVAISGYVLMFPFYGTDMSGMQTAQMVHGVVAVLFVAVMLGHIYIGTVGMEGAFEAMGSGEVDLNWARQHHSLWARSVENERRDIAQPGRANVAPAE